MVSTPWLPAINFLLMCFFLRGYCWIIFLYLADADAPHTHTASAADESEILSVVDRYAASCVCVLGCYVR